MGGGDGDCSVTAFLAELQADIRAAGKQQGTGMGPFEGEQSVKVHWCKPYGIPGCQRILRCWRCPVGDLPVRRGTSARLARRLDDRAIACATAEIAGEGLVNGFIVRGPALLAQRPECHDKPRSTEPALACMTGYHCLLDGIGSLIPAGQPLDRRETGAVKLAQGVEACVDGFGPGAAMAHHGNGTGAAVPFRAPLLGAPEAGFTAQIVQHRHRRYGRRDHALRAVQKETHARLLTGPIERRRHDGSRVREAAAPRGSCRFRCQAAWCRFPPW